MDRGKTRKLSLDEVKSAIRLYVATMDAFPAPPSPDDVRVLERADVFFDSGNEGQTSPVIDHVLVTWVE